VSEAPIRLPTTSVGWMALCAYDEARNQLDDGKAAVCQVIKNRANLSYQSDGTIMGTVLHPMAFSGFWCDMVNGHYVRVAHTIADAQGRAAAKFAAAIAQPQLWSNLMEIATDVMGGHYEPQGPEFALLCPDALLYCNMAVSAPTWATRDRFITRIGAHSFYRD